MERKNTIITLLATVVTLIFIGLTIYDFFLQDYGSGTTEFFRFTTGMIFVIALWSTIYKNRKKKVLQTTDQLPTK
ncbi:MAG: hypothetical protein WDA22_17425 [Bacteroidota bacterium]